jgi:hypothetical protein
LKPRNSDHQLIETRTDGYSSSEYSVGRTVIFQPVQHNR